MYKQYKSPSFDFRGLNHLHLRDCPDDVQVWLADLNQLLCLLGSFEKYLSSEEKRRVKRFQRNAHVRCFVLRRGLLRVLCAHFLQMHPARIGFSYHETGKPYLKNACAKGSLFFNLSHSGKYAIFAFSDRRELGVDVELIQGFSEMGGLVHLYFSEPEKALFHSLSRHLKYNAFFTIWTRKEALLKATGYGLSQLSEKPDVSSILCRRFNLQGLNEGSIAGHSWSLVDLQPAFGLAGALAFENIV